MPRLLRHVLSFLLLAFLPVFAAHAQLTIEIVGGAGTAIPIAIVPFEGESNYPLGITGIVGADLTRSGLFKLVDYAWGDPGDQIRAGQTNSAGDQVEAIPDQGSLGLLALGGAGLMVWRKGRRSSAGSEVSLT